MLLSTHGIVNQVSGVIVGSRPTTAIEFTLDSLIQSVANNQFNLQTNTNEAFSFAFWFKAKAGAPDYNYHFGRETNSGDRSYNGYTSTETVNRTEFLTSYTGGSDTLQNANSFDQDIWYFIVYTASLVGTSKKVYAYDESSLLNISANTNYGGVRNNFNFEFLIGCARKTFGEVSSQAMNSFGVWNRQITDAEVLELWNSGAGLSYSNLTGSSLLTTLNEWWDMDYWDGTSIVGQENSATMIEHGSGYITTLQLVPTNSRPTTAIQFNLDSFAQETGDNQFNFSLNSNQAFSVAFWFRAPAGAPDYNYHYGRETIGSDVSYKTYTSTETANNTQFQTHDGVTSDTLVNAQSFDQDIWYFIVQTATLVGTSKKVYAYSESSLLGISANTSYAGVRANTNFKFLIGCGRLSLNNVSTAAYNSFGVWNRELTASEVTQLWNSGAGLSYADLDSGLKTTLNEWWDFNTWNTVSQVGQHAGATMVKNGPGTITNISV